jgi:hypothetical protein
MGTGKLCHDENRIHADDMMMMMMVMRRGRRRRRIALY